MTDRNPEPAADDDTPWMQVPGDLDDLTVEDLLAGAPAAQADLALVTELVTRLRASAAAEPVPPMSAALRQQLETPMVISLEAGRAARRSLAKAGAAAAAALAVTLVGVGASQNRLPTGVQDVVSSTAELVGVDVPRSEERSQGPAHRSDRGEERSRDEEAPPVESPPEGSSDARGDGATPADPNGSGEPATPAVPPDPATTAPSAVPVDPDRGPADDPGPADEAPAVSQPTTSTTDPEVDRGRKGTRTAEG